MYSNKKEDNIWTESFDYPIEVYGNRDDIKASGFFRILDSLYLEGMLTSRPLSYKMTEEDGRKVFSFKFEREDV